MADQRLWDPDPAVRLQAWRDLAANAGISAQTCDHLDQAGFHELAFGLLRARGDST